MNTFNVLEECRACLRQLGEEKRHQLFEPWPSPRCGTLLANDLAALANIQILETDKYPKAICVDCYKNFKEAWMFIATVKNSDSLLKQITDKIEDGDSSWPQPIDINQHVSGVIDNVEVEVKQEILSEDENTEPMDTWEPRLDIKIEPEEITAPDQSNISIKGDNEHKENDENGVGVNGIDNHYSDEEYLDNAVKQEPLSSDEDVNQDPSSLECILCAKQFFSVTGLKAHVIAQHSYKTVKRKCREEPAPVEIEEHICISCRKTFATRTDLMVHEVEHKSHTCFVCRDHFTTFAQLARHSCRPGHAPGTRTYSSSSKSQAKLKQTANNDQSKTEHTPLFDNVASTEVNITSLVDSIKKDFDIVNQDAVEITPTVELSVESLDSTDTHLENSTVETDENTNVDMEKLIDESETHSNEQNKENVAIENIKINQNMEVHLAINPIEEDAVMLDSKLEESAKLESDSFEPKIVSVSEIHDNQSEYNI